MYHGTFMWNVDYSTPWLAIGSARFTQLLGIIVHIKAHFYAGKSQKYHYSIGGLIMLSKRRAA